MAVLGGQLKRKESLSARLGDTLSALYLMSSVLKRSHDDQEPADDRAIVHWCCEQLLYDCENSLYDAVLNFPVTWVRCGLKWILFPYGRRRHKPRDFLIQQIAEIITKPSETRSRLSRLAFYEDIPNCPIGRVEAAFLKICEVETLEKKLKHALKETHIKSLTRLGQIEEAKAMKIITPSEAHALQEAEHARQYVVAVDDFEHLTVHVVQ